MIRFVEQIRDENTVQSVAVFEDEEVALWVRSYSDSVEVSTENGAAVFQSEVDLEVFISTLRAAWICRRRLETESVKAEVEGKS